MSYLWMLAYDISSDGARKAVHDLLLSYGQRVQYSVFECRLTHPQQQMLAATLIEFISATDSLRWYPLCEWCEKKVTYLGNGNAVDDSGFFLV
jgi:CRISPR-associated protein Cas2